MECGAAPQFRLFMDLDLKYVQNEQSKWPLLLRVVTLIQQAALTFFNSVENLTMIVCILAHFIRINV